MASNTHNPKIVYLLPGGLFNSGGMERTITLKANYLSDMAGCEVSIVTTEQMGRPVFYPLSAKVKLFHLDIGIHERFDRENYLEKIFSRTLKTREYRRKLSQLLNEIRPDITISTLGLDIGFINNLNDGSVKIGELHFPRNFRALMAGKLSKSLIPNLVAKIRTTAMIRQCKRLQRLVVLTEEEKSFWTADDRIEVIPNPLSFLPEKTATLTEKSALAIGRLAFEKGFDMLINSWNKVHHEIPDWRLSLYGNGNCRDALQQQIDSLGLADSATVHSPTTDIQSVYQQNSLFLFPSRYLEAMPMVLLEAMSFGLPVIAFDAPCGPKDLIEDGRNGFLVKTGNVQAFAEKIALLAKSPELRKTMGREARKQAENFRIEKIMPRWLNLFNSLIRSQKLEVKNQKPEISNQKLIVVSGINLFRGGTLKIMQDCIAALSAYCKDQFEIIALVHNENQYPEYPNVRYISFPKSRKSWFFRLYYEYIGFMRLSKQWKPWCWFSLHDTTPNVRAEHRMVYCHNTFSFYNPGFRNLFVQPDIVMFSLFSRFIHRINIRRNNFVIVQQEWLRETFKRQFGIENVVVSLPIKSEKFYQKMTQIEKVLSKNDTKKLFFYPSTPMIHKNFEVLCRAGIALQAEGFDNFEIAITLDGTENRYSNKIYRQFSHLPFVRFTGLLSREEMNRYYQQCDCVVFASKIESWGMPVSEAKEFDKPVFVSELPYSRETVGKYNKACFFNPDDVGRLTVLMHDFLLGKIVYDPTEAVVYQQPFARDWDELVKMLISRL